MKRSGNGSGNGGNGDDNVPEWAAEAEHHPGEMIGEALKLRGMSQAELARRIGITPKHVNRVTAREAPVTPNLAIGLEGVLHIPARLFLCMQSDYDLARAREGLRRQREEGPE